MIGEAPRILLPLLGVMSLPFSLPLPNPPEVTLPLPPLPRPGVFNGVPPLFLGRPRRRLGVGSGSAMVDQRNQKNLTLKYLP